MPTKSRERTATGGDKAEAKQSRYADYRATARRPHRLRTVRFPAPRRRSLNDALERFFTILPPTQREDVGAFLVRATETVRELDAYREGTGTHGCGHVGTFG